MRCSLTCFFDLLLLQTLTSAKVATTAAMVVVAAAVAATVRFVLAAALAVALLTHKRAQACSVGADCSAACTMQWLLACA